MNTNQAMYKTMKARAERKGLLLLALLTLPIVVQAVDVYQDATTKAFAPFSFGVNTGDTVVWHFSTASPGNAVARRVYVPGTMNPYTPGHYAIAPYTPTYANEFVGPMIEAPSGIFALSQTGYGMV